MKLKLQFEKESNNIDNEDKVSYLYWIVVMNDIGREKDRGKWDAEIKQQFGV